MKNRTKLVIFFVLVVSILLQNKVTKKATDVFLNKNAEAIKLSERTPSANVEIRKSINLDKIEKKAFSVMKKIESENSDKSDEELRIEIYKISKILQSSAAKTFNDFTPEELEQYNMLNRKKVVLQRILFRRKYDSLNLSKLNI